ncbi:MAG: hypothetical protein CUN55_02580 [Phototrophicales bacterium]|nr:MAG: hypothetical protein CUN55_02580 [Phototrophicales bacterium]
MSFITLRKYLQPPPTTEDNRLSKIAVVIHWLLWIAIFVAFANLLVGLFVDLQDETITIAAPIAIVVNLILIYFLHIPPYSRWVVHYIGWFGLFIIAVLALFSGGVFTPPFVAFAIAILLNTYLQGRRAGFLTFGLIVVFTGFFLYFEPVSATEGSAFQRLFGFTVYYGFLTLTIDFIVSQLKQALKATEEQRTILANQRRYLAENESLLSMLAAVSQEFLRADDWKDCINDVLAMVGNVADVDRVYVYQILENLEQEWIVTKRYEWVRSGVISYLDDPIFERFPLREQGFGRWIDVLTEGNVIAGVVKDFPQSERDFLEPRNIAAQLAVPIYVEGTLWGFVGFDVETPRNWSITQINMLRTFGEMMGLAIQNTNTSQRLFDVLTEQVKLNEELRQHQAHTEQREKLLGVLADVVGRFLREDEWLDVVRGAFPEVCTALEVDRVYVYRIEPLAGNLDWQLERVYYYPDDQDLTTLKTNGVLTMRDLGLERWVEKLRSGESVVALVDELPQKEQVFTKSPTASFFAAMPIRLREKNIWGFTCFVRLQEEGFTSLQFDILQAVVDALGMAIQRANVYQHMLEVLQYEQQQNTELREKQIQIEKRDRLLKMIAEVTGEFLSNDSWLELLPEVMPAIGRAAEAERVFLFQIVDETDDDWCVSSLISCRVHEKNPTRDPRFQNFSLRAAGLAHWVTHMRQYPSLIVHTATSDSAAELALLESVGVVSYLSVPFKVGERWWGILGFATETHHEWQGAQIDALIVLADALGATIQRAEALQRLVQNEAELRTILSTLPDPLMRIDRFGKFVEVYNLPSNYQHYHLEQYQGHYLADFWLDDAAAQQYLQQLQNYLASDDEYPLTEIVDLNLPRVGKRTIMATVVRWDADSVLVLWRDVTQMKMAEALLQASEAKFRAVYQGSPDILLLTDAETDIVLEVNPALEHILGIKIEQLAGSPIKRLFYLTDTAFSEIYAQAKANTTAFGAAHVTTHQGRKIPLDVTGVRLSLPTGDAVLLILRDTSERAEIAKLNVLLQKERELNQLRQQFIQTVSHEFRTPLAIIQMNVEMLNTYGDRLSPEKRANRTDTILRQIEYMEKMIKNVTRYGELLQDVMLQPKQIDIREFIENIVKDVDSLHDVPRIGLTMNIFEPHYYGDPELLRQAIQNLLNNALRYSKPEQSVFVEVKSNKKEVRIRIADEGVGIPPEFLSRIFEPFQRGENVQNIGGTGIGLTITKNIIEQHGGNIQVQSELGVGTVFEIVLPQDAIPRQLFTQEKSADMPSDTLE